jgi:transposase
MEIKKPRTYTDEFRRNAVNLANELGSVKKAAAQLGIHEANIYGWKVTMNPAKSSGESPEEELRRLRKETSEQKKVIHVLKAAAAFFSQDHLK